MVGRILIVFIPFLFHFFSLLGEQVVVTAQIEGKLYAGMPLEGSITITHNTTSVIDPNGFLLGNKPLKVVYDKDVKVDPRSSLTISIYRFSLEPRSEGLHELPEVSASVGGTVYRSIASTYEVGKPLDAKKTPPSNANLSGITLKIEALMEGKPTLYPGQRLKVGYRYTYNLSVDLSHEEIPLLEAKGFRKIGEKEFNNYVKNKMIYLDAIQVIEAIKPGEYVFPAAKIQGRAYRVNRLGQKTYAQSDSYAESEPVTLKVLSFPDKGKPSSFNGAIGSNLTFEMKRTSSEPVAVGDKIELVITIQGTGELATLPMPEVCCQPGFSGFFRVSDLPAVETLVGSVKTFKVEMRPLSDKIQEIPVLEFSYFNPETQAYTALKSGPIPLKVVSLPSSSKLPEEKKEAKEPDLEDKTAPTPLAIEIEGNFPLTLSDLHNRWLGTWHVFLALPLGAGLLLFQVQSRRFFQDRKNRKNPKKSGDLFQEALLEKAGSGPFFDLLEKAFLLKLVEEGEIKDPKVGTDSLPTTGLSGEVRTFLKEIEKQRFSGDEEGLGTDFIAQAKKIFFKGKADV